ncbi:MAG TPA: MFS transporter [Mycobacteriales bacterium]|nr:MFS transporter [Mycobacteriales bacterium]
MTSRIGHTLGHPRWILVAVLSAWSLSVADFFVVNVALPTIGRSLHAGPATLELVVAGYAAAYACGLVTGGRLGDGYGRRRVLLVGMAAFVVTSTACGLAPSPAFLVAARILQGLSAALMGPQVLATIQATFTGAARRRALGAFGATIGLATVAGQLLGAVIVAADLGGLSWRPAFLLNLPVGVGGMILARRVVPDSREPAARRVDGPGALLLAWAVGALLVPATLGRDEGWPVWCWLVLGTAPVGAVAFGASQRRAERRGRTPLLPPSLLRDVGMRRGIGVLVPFFVGAGGFLLTMAVTLQTGKGFGALRAGFVMMPYAVGFLLASRCVARLTGRYGNRVIVAGAIGLALAFTVLAVQLDRDYAAAGVAALAPGLLVVGFTQGLVMVPLFGAVLATVEPARAGVAGGALATVQQLGMALGAAVLGTLLFSVAAGHGWRSATVAVFAVEAILAAATAAAAGRLPGAIPSGSGGRRVSG